MNDMKEIKACMRFDGKVTSVLNWLSGVVRAIHWNQIFLIIGLFSFLETHSAY